MGENTLTNQDETAHNQAVSNIERIIEQATDVLGTRERAEDWIDQFSATLEAKPRDLADTDEGTETVLLHLAGISRHSHDA